ncbi:MAG TPA: DinB family protein [Anaerolineales bacterium]|nr:DinB family protein [Anaerolineales bacterium]
MSTFNPAELANRLQFEGEKTVEFFKTIPVDKWNEQAYTDGEHWNIHQILTHITQAEDSVSRLVAHVVSGRGGVPVDFDLDGYNQRKVKEMQEDSPENLIALFAERRARTVSFTAKLKDTDLQKTGRHPFLGIAPVEDMLKLMYRHTQLHQRDIRKLLGQE